MYSVSYWRWALQWVAGASEGDSGRRVRVIRGAAPPAYEVGRLSESCMSATLFDEVGRTWHRDDVGLAARLSELWKRFTFHW